MENKRNYWLHRNNGGINASKVARKLLLEHNIISIGWFDFVHYDGVINDIKNNGIKAVDMFYSKEGWALSRGRYSLKRFIKDMQVGDIVLVPTYDKLSLYQITGDVISLNDLAYKDEIEKVDLGFFRPVEPIENCISLSRSEYAEGKLYNRLRMMQTNANITDLASIIDDIVAGKKSTIEEEYSTFDIDASAYRLMATRSQKDTKRNLLAEKQSYNIPWYQRAYSWGEEQVDRLMTDIFNGYWAETEDENKMEILKTPLFIGNMQLTANLPAEDDLVEQDIVDGQQRISTLFILLKYISVKFNLPIGTFDWLSTDVGGGNENIKLNKLKALTEKDFGANIDDTNNTYLQNFIIIKNFFEQTIAEKAFNINDFLDYILNDIYFVVVTTKASISDTIKIFGTINTAGLDLNGGDMFKVRMYDYIQAKGLKLTGNDIDNLYKEIDNYNEKYKKDYSILKILSVYQDYLIAKYGLAKILYKYGVERFFDNLFDCITNAKQWEHFDKNITNGIIIDIKEISRFIDIVYQWDMHVEEKDQEKMFERCILGTTRYANYQDLAYLVLYQYKEDFEKVERLISLLSRLFIIYSIKYAKVVNNIHTFVYDLRSILIKENNYEKAIEEVKKLLYNSNLQIEERIGGYIADSPMNKNLICRLSEYLAIVDAKDKCQLYPTLDDLKKQLFETKFDIEHIHANADASITISKEDLALQNGIGNLALLEFSINREIKAECFAKKKNDYQDSNFYTLKCIIGTDESTDWDKSKMEERKNHEVKRIVSYLFD